MDGWKKIGEILVCASCGNIIEEIKNDKTAASRKPDDSNDKLEKFASILGTEKIQKKKIEIDNKIFCRDCKYYIKHPFFSKCGLSNKEVNPMDDCNSFIKRKKCSEK